MCSFRTDFWPFLHCINKYEEDQDLGKAEQCAKETNLDWGNISTCQSGKMGYK